MTYSGLVLLSIASVVALLMALVLTILERDDCPKCGGSLRIHRENPYDCPPEDEEWQLPPLRFSSKARG